MKNVLKYALIFLLVPALFITGCKEDEPVAETYDGYAVLSSYMKANAMDLDDLLSGWVIAAGDVADAEGVVADYHVFDIRDADTYANGHIKGAINVALADVVTTAQNYSDKPILVACFTGQTAGHAVMALRLSGFADAKVLKWGMAGWNDAFMAPWENNHGDNGVGHANWVTDAAPATGEYANPTWSTTLSSGAEILAERVNAMLTDGFKGVAYDGVLETPANYNIINFWSNEDYLAFGHFDGAYQVKPITLEGGEVKAFDPARESVVYCYTGQTSSMTTAWLNVLGYNVKSLKFGVNALNYTGLHDAEKPNYHGTAGLPYESGVTVNHYDVLKSYLIENDMDLPDLLNGWVIAAADVADANGVVADYHVFDIRAAADYEAGHIIGAINVASADVLTEAANYTDKPILVACYTGQGAGHAVMALRLSGFADAKVLKWGMAGWNDAFMASWDNNTGDNGVGHANWVTTEAPAAGDYADPSWTATATSGADILAERVEWMLTEGFKGITYDGVLETPADYNIVNFWSNEDYLAFGHFDGAYQVKPISLEGGEVKSFDPSKESVVYCYTGQTSSITTAWLNILGYNVKSLKFGVNALNYTGLHDAGKPNYHGTAGLPYETK